MEIKASDVKKYVENFSNYFKNISDTDLQIMIENMNNIKHDESSNKQDFFDSKNNFITHMSKEKNMTIKKYNDKYITLIGECCALDKIGFVSLDKNEVPYQVCNYIDYLEKECRNKKEEARELAYKIKFNEKSRRKMQQSLMKQINDLEHQCKQQKEVIDKAVEYINQHFKHHPELFTENQIEYENSRNEEEYEII